MPIGDSIPMILSLFIALTIVPYLAYHFLKGDGKADSDDEDGGGAGRFYSGGQFTPGGGRAPVGGVYIR
jgi:multidrug efflux pump subunit AcrB